MAEKIQKAKEAYYKMVSMIQQQSAWFFVNRLIMPWNPCPLKTDFKQI